MCCAVTTLVLLGPRILDVLLWLFWPQFTLAFKNDFIVPLLGVLLLPWTTLMYVLVWQPATGVSGFGWFMLGLGLCRRHRFVHGRWLGQPGQDPGVRGSRIV